MFDAEESAVAELDPAPDGMPDGGGAADELRLPAALEGVLDAEAEESAHIAAPLAHKISMRVAFIPSAHPSARKPVTTLAGTLHVLSAHCVTLLA